MISWGAVRTIAVTLASRTEKPPNGDFDYAAAVEETLGPLSEFTGIELPQGPPRDRQLRIADRAEWIDFNIEGFGVIMEPVLKRAAATSYGGHPSVIIIPCSVSVARRSSSSASSFW